MNCTVVVWPSVEDWRVVLCASVVNCIVDVSAPVDDSNSVVVSASLDDNNRVVVSPTVEVSATDDVCAGVQMYMLLFTL